MVLRRGSMRLVIDTHAVARRLNGVGLSTAQADATPDAVREAAEHDACVTPEACAPSLPAARRA